MPTVNSSGTLTADGTVQTVADVTDNKYFTFKLDTAAMDTGDTTVIIISDVVLAAGTYRVYKTETYTGPQTEPIKFLAPLWITQKIKVTVQQTTIGTYRDYPWALLQA